MVVNANDVTKDLIAYTIANDKQSLKNLLRRNGIDVKSDASDNDIIISVLIASRKSPVFKSELTDILTQKAIKIQNEFKSFAGGQFEIGNEADKMMFTGDDFFKNMGGLYVSPKLGEGISAAAQQQQSSQSTKSAKQPKTPKTKEKGKAFEWLKTNVFTQDNINSGIQLGLNVLNNKLQQKSNQVQYEAADISSRQQEIVAAQNQKKSASFNVTTIAVVVVSLAIVGGIVYYVAKKK